MRVGVNSLFLIPGEVGGSQTYLSELLVRLRSASPDMELVLFTNKENDSFLRELLAGHDKMEFHPLRLHARQRTARILAEQFTLPGMARKTGIDVLWSPGYTAPFSAPCPQVVTIFDMQYKDHPEDLSKAALLATSLLVPMAARRADLVLTLSQFGKNQILKHVPMPCERIKVTHAAADPSFARADLPAEVGEPCDLLPDNRPFILCVANTYPHKNVHSLVRAFADLAGKIGHRLVLVGRAGRGEPETAAALAALPDRSRVTRLADLTRRQLIGLYRAADIFVFPSLYEGFGLPVLEAMVAGVPVLTTGEGPMPEIGGDTVRYCDGSSAGLELGILDIVSLSAEERMLAIEHATDQASLFSWERTATETARLLTETAMKR